MMDNAEDVMHSLEEFSKLKPKVIPRELEDYLGYVAKTGDPVFKWTMVKYLFREKMLSVINDFYEDTLTIDLPPCPNVDAFNYDRMKTSLLERLESFHGAPFTIQRICELLTNPRKEYNRADKFMRAIEKNILVVSTREPGRYSDDCESTQECSINGIREVGDSLDSTFIINDLGGGPDSSSPGGEVSPDANHLNPERVSPERDVSSDSDECNLENGHGKSNGLENLSEPDAANVSSSDMNLTIEEPGQIPQISSSHESVISTLTASPNLREMMVGQALEPCVLTDSTHLQVEQVKASEDEAASKELNTPSESIDPLTTSIVAAECDTSQEQSDDSPNNMDIPLKYFPAEEEASPCDSAESQTEGVESNTIQEQSDECPNNMRMDIPLKCFPAEEEVSPCDSADSQTEGAESDTSQEQNDDCPNNTDTLKCFPGAENVSPCDSAEPQTEGAECDTSQQSDNNADTLKYFLAEEEAVPCDSADSQTGGAQTSVVDQPKVGAPEESLPETCIEASVIQETQPSQIDQTASDPPSREEIPSLVPDTIKDSVSQVEELASDPTPSEPVSNEAAPHEAECTAEESSEAHSHTSPQPAAEEPSPSTQDLPDQMEVPFDLESINSNPAQSDLQHSTPSEPMEVDE